MILPGSPTAGIDIPAQVAYPPKPLDWPKRLGAGAGECGRCRAWWTGASTAHCGGCHETFTGMTAFDKHRVGSHERGTRHCVDPASVGLMETTARGGYPCWSLPGDDRRWWDTDGS